MEFIAATTQANLTDFQIASRGSSFMVALLEFPSWAIAEAIIQWHKVGGSFPTPKDIRELTENICKATDGKITVLERILKASSLPEYSPEHKITMLEKLKALFIPRKLNASL